MTTSPTRISRGLDPAHLDRADKVVNGLVGPYLEEIAISLHTSLDMWRFHDGPAEEVELALDAFLALWTSAVNRGMVS